MLLFISFFTILLSTIVLTKNWNTNKNAVFLFAFLVITAIYGITHYLVVYGKSPFWLAIFYNHFTPPMLALGPLLFFYIRGTLNGYYILQKRDLVHFIPALVQLIGIAPYLLMDFSKKLDLATEIIHNIDSIRSIDTNYFYTSESSFLIRSISLLVYIIYCIYCIRLKISSYNFEKEVTTKHYLSNFRWLITFVSCLLLVSIYFLVLTIISINTKPSEGILDSYPVYIVSGIAYFAMSFSLLLFPNILYGIPNQSIKTNTNQDKVSTFDKRKEKRKLDTLSHHKNKSLQEKSLDELAEKIQAYLEEEKPFLNSTFSISDIALALKIPQNQVCFCINEVMGTKFSKLKSDLRVQHAIQLLESNAKEALTIEGIGVQAGFNTRSSFYNSFKAITELTPTEFISKQQGA